MSTTPPSSRSWVDWTDSTRAIHRADIVHRLDLLGHPLRWLLMIGLLVAWFALPLVLTGFLLKLYVYIGIAAIAAMGLNLLSGNAGQVSLGHPFFIGMGAYCAAVVGGDWGLPLPVWLAACALLGGAVGVFYPAAVDLHGLVGRLWIDFRGRDVGVVVLECLGNDQRAARQRGVRAGNQRQDTGDADGRAAPERSSAGEYAQAIASSLLFGRLPVPGAVANSSG